MGTIVPIRIKDILTKKNWFFVEGQRFRIHKIMHNDIIKFGNEVKTIIVVGILLHSLQFYSFHNPQFTERPQILKVKLDVQFVHQKFKNTKVSL